MNLSRSMPVIGSKKLEPFPHTIITLSAAEYQEILDAWPSEFKVSRSGLKENAPGLDFSWKTELGKQLCELFDLDGIPTKGRFMSRKAGYKLPPHIDPPGLNITIIHYLPLEGQGEEAGTVLYKSRKIPQWEEGKSTIYLWLEDCQPVMTVPFRARTGLAFPNTPKAIHGVPKTSVERRLYQWHLAAL